MAGLMLVSRWARMISHASDDHHIDRGPILKLIAEIRRRNLFALKVKGQKVRTSPIGLAAVWYPVMSDVRQLPQFKKIVTELNLVEYWRVYGWSDACRPLGDDNFECS